MDKVVHLKNALEIIYGVSVSLVVLVDAKDLYNCLSSQRNATDKSVRVDVNAIRFCHETSVDVFGWILGSVNPADVRTKLNSPLVDTLTLTLVTGIPQFDLQSLESVPGDCPLG